MNTLFEVKNIFVENNNVKILKDISFKLNRGEVLGIIGESGCGKSTLLRAISNMMNPSENITNGEVIFKNQNLHNLSDKEMRKILGEEIGIVFQNPAVTLNATAKIGKQFTELIKSHKKMKKKDCLNLTLEMLEKMNLNHKKCLIDSYPFELSGGMNQRIAIALSMILKPEVLICDEPTSALDVTVQKRIIDEMIDLKNEFDTSIIIVTHDMGVVSHMCNKVAVMYGGEIVEYGTKEELLNNPLHPYTKALINAIPKLSGELPKPIKGYANKFDELQSGCAFASRCEYCKEGCTVDDSKNHKINDNHFVKCNNWSNINNE